MADRFGDWVNEDQWDVDDEEEDDPLDPMRFDPWRGFQVVPGEYADDGGYIPPWEAYAVEMTDHWRRCPACGVVERSPSGVDFWRDDCEECNPLPF